MHSVSIFVLEAASGCVESVQGRRSHYLGLGDRAEVRVVVSPVLVKSRLCLGHHVSHLAHSSSLGAVQSGMDFSQFIIACDGR